MTSRKISLLLAASVFLTGATGVFLGSMAPAHAITSVDELTDVNQDHWAYEALRDLVEKYDVIEGYPDHTFRGERAATRWEMAAALNALIKAVGRDLARLGAEKANKSDLQALARLQEEFRNELNALNARTTALEARAAAIEAKNEEQDTRLTLLEKTQIHGDLSFGGFADIGSNGVDVAGGLNDDNDGFLDGISAVGRLRLTMDVPVRDDQEDSKWGRGDVHVRMIGAFGRWAPRAGDVNNAGAFNPFSGYSRIASDASAFNEGFNMSTGNQGVAGFGANNRSNLYIENMHYKQHVKDGVPLLTDWMFDGEDDEAWETTADIYAGVVPWRYLYDKSPYRGNELTQFQNTAFVNTPGVLTNYNMPMVAYALHQKLGSDDLSFDLTTGVGSINNSDVMDGLNTTYEARLNYVLGALPGSVYAGGIHTWLLGNSASTATFTGLGTNRSFAAITALNSRAGQRDTSHSFYTGWNQEWWNGIGTTVNYMWASQAATNVGYTTLNNAQGQNSALINEVVPIALGVRQSISGVLHIPMKALGLRENDVFGVGYGIIDLQEDGILDTAFIDDGVEHVMEAYYKWQMTDSISLVPSFQLIANRLGVEQNDLSYVIGLRTNFTF